MGFCLYAQRYQRRVIGIESVAVNAKKRTTSLAGCQETVSSEQSNKIYEEVKAHAESRGETVNGFIKRAIAETMERDTGSGN